MQAIVQDRYGGLETLELRDIDRPVPKEDEVLVRVGAAGLDRGVWHVMAGLPYLIRFVGFGVRQPKVRVRGMDLAGRVEAVGRNVTRFRPGDEVFGWCDGSYAEYACAPEDNFAPKPATLTLEQAAVVPISAFAALQAVRDSGAVQAGQKVLVIGAAGGVGSFAVQLAKAFGADVTGVCGTAQVDRVRSIGADEVIDYTREDLADGSRRRRTFEPCGSSSKPARSRRSSAGPTPCARSPRPSASWSRATEAARSSSPSPTRRPMRPRCRR
jgi:NADPH:quinone reductase-like Zn-dependent oxidoreductase